MIGSWNETVARSKIAPLMIQCGLKFSETKYKIDVDHSFISRTNGLRLSPHRNTWKRKRETAYLVRAEYVIDGSTLMVHVEPWANFPSDLFIARLMLLPPEVKNNAT